jgi:hypothetical protein
MNHDPDRQPFGVDERVKLAAFHLLAGVIPQLDGSKNLAFFGGF